MIGLGLCPFAESVYRADRVRFQVSEQRSVGGLLAELRAELVHLHGIDPGVTDTTLLIHPWVLTDFLDFNDFLPFAESAVVDLDLEGEIQVASFHPGYQFAGTRPDDIENCTNRSPYPTLHLLREASVEQALKNVPDPDAIYERNIERLRQLGPEGWRDLWTGAG